VIAFLSLHDAYLELKVEIDTAIQRVLDGGWYIAGPEVEAFETEWAEYCGAKHAVGVANGLDALVLALRALGVGKGDEVIVPSHTFIATWLAVSSVGAIPVPVDPEPGTYTIDPSGIARAITARTRAIIPVHLYGHPADLNPILALAREHGLFVVEDAAQSHGARYHGKRIGAHGDIVCWSFYPGKNLGAMGDAGAITTDNADLAQSIRLLGNYGSSRKYVHAMQGVNSRLDPIQAAVLRAKLRHLDAWTDRRKSLADGYSVALEDLGLVLPQVAAYADHVWHLYVVQTDRREALMEQLAKAGIGSLIHYPIPPHMQEAYGHLGIPADGFPRARQLATNVLSLPMGPQVPVHAPQAVRDVLQAAMARG
jgi:dTDP-4-amino-4,6-dideoxygalactose transaminase